MTRSAATSSPRPIVATVSPSTSTSAWTVSPAVTTVPPLIRVLTRGVSSLKEWDRPWGRSHQALFVSGGRGRGGLGFPSLGREHHHEDEVEHEGDEETDDPAVVVEWLEDSDQAAGRERSWGAGCRVGATDRQGGTRDDADQTS